MVGAERLCILIDDHCWRIGILSEDALTLREVIPGHTLCAQFGEIVLKLDLRQRRCCCDADDAHQQQSCRREAIGREGLSASNAKEGLWVTVSSDCSCS